MFLPIHPQDPQPRNIAKAVEILRKGGVIVYPTDTIYGLGCDIFQQKAIERICRIKNINPLKAQLSFVCSDLSEMSKYIRQIPTVTYRMLKYHLPGPYTFILQASKEVPKLLKNKKNTVGLRIPDNNIALSIVRTLGNPILSVSLPGEMVEEYTDPALIYDKFHKQVDLVIDGGIGGILPSTIIDCTGEEPVVTRHGLGAWESVH
ncbi:MAG: threonylcarbamoyl-AMP synthase [Chitinophagaceae bacterium]|nr:threonylcarbamoyl-AMP synthase [Chitinophagaceae bacterium]